MNDIQVLNRRYETIAWGALLLWIGAVWLVPGEDFGIGWLGVGAILLGLNLARRFHKIPMNWLSTTLGVIALMLGVAKLLLLTLGLNLVLPLLPILMIGFGASSLIRMVVRRGS